MMDLATIQAMSDEAAQKAQRAKKEPFGFFDAEHLERFFNERREKFPNLGGYVPKGWKKVEELFCDHSGFGSPYEPALTMEQLRLRLREHIKDGNRFGYAITEVGQFQLQLGVFEREVVAPPKKRRTKAKKTNESSN